MALSALFQPILNFFTPNPISPIDPPLPPQLFYFPSEPTDNQPSIPLSPIPLPSPTPPPPPLQPYNEPLEVAHSRIHHALHIKDQHPYHLLASIHKKLSAPWVERDWRERAEARSTTAQSAFEDDPTTWGNASRRHRERERRREETMRTIWEYQIQILRGQARAALHPGIYAEARRRYEFEVLERGGGEFDELEVSIRDKMDQEVDKEKEFGVEWEICRLMLEMCLTDSNTIERMGEVLHDKPEPGWTSYDQKARDRARHTIFRRLFLEDVHLTPRAWEEQLRIQILHIESLGRGGMGRVGLEETRALVGELEYYRSIGGFPRNFVTRYGGGAVRGRGWGVRASEKEEVERRLVWDVNQRAGW